MSNLPQLQGSGSPKFLTTSEKTARWVVGGGIGLAAFTGLYKALPYIIHFMEMGIEAGFKLLVLSGVMAIVGLVAAIALNPTVHAAVWYWYQDIVDSIAFSVVKIRPTARLRAYVSHYLVPMKGRIQAARDRASGRLKSAEGRLSETKESLSQLEQRAAYLLSHGSRDGGHSWSDTDMRTQFSTASAKIRTVREAAKRLEKREAIQKGYVAIMDQLLSVVSAYVEVTEFNVDMMIQEYESTEEMVQGTRDVQDLLSKSEKTKLANMTAQHMTDEMNAWMGEVEGVMNALKPQIDAVHLDDAINEEALMRELSERVNKMSTFAEGQRQLTAGGEAVLLTSAKSRVYEAVPVNAPDDQSSAASPANPSSRFRRLLPPR